tara:strand:- start:219 stop:632 length:414 start_codon:yes stop_codon:yes gene_type:complete
MQTKFIKFTKFEVDKIWPLARDLIQKACDTNGAFNAEDIKEKCKQGSMQLWLVVDETDKVLATVVTEIRTYPNYKVCDARIVTGIQMSRWHHHVEDLEAWAKEEGCKKMELFARPGWEKVMKPKGYLKTHVQIEKAL